MFDPPHLGHMVLAGEARWQLGLDEVRMVVTARPPHRSDGWLPAEGRLRMVQAAIGGRAGLVASRAEIDRPGPNYTADTVAAFAAAEPDAALWVVLGADQLAGLASWRDPDRIVAMARLAAVVRDGTDAGAAERVAADLGARVDWIRMPVIGISSTLIRERLATGAPVDHLLPAGVGDMLVTQGFVQSDARDTLRMPSRTT